MPILSGDIQLRAAERMTDAEDGGGEMSSTVVADGAVHAVFPPISESDRVGGRVALRELYLHIDTPTADTYYGANAIVDAPPTDPNVSVVLFDVGVSGAERSTARDHVERYVVQGPRSTMHPIGTQLAGQRQIAAYQRLEAALPEVGDVYALRVESGALAGQQQFVRVTSVAAEQRAFTYLNPQNVVEEFTRRSLTIGISQALSYDFAGSDPTPLLPGATWIRTTVVADSARYYGITPLAQAVAMGALELQLASIWGQLVPGSTAEVPVLDTRVATVVSTVSAGAHSVQIAESGHSAADAITLATRGYTYTRTLRPIPSPGTLTVSYRAQGRWYTLTDDGTGVLRGPDSAYGVGTVSSTTGACMVTLGALPDVGSAIIWSWGTAAHYTQRLTAQAPRPSITHELGEAVAPGSLVLTWLLGGVEQTATAAADGVVTGAGVTGYLVHSTGSLYAEWTGAPADPGSLLGIDYDAVATETLVLAGLTATAGHVTFSLAGPVRPGSLECRWAVRSTVTHSRADPYYVWDAYHDPNGQLAGWTRRQEGQSTHADSHLVEYQMRAADDGAGGLPGGGAVVYATGACDLVVLLGVIQSSWSEAAGSWSQSESAAHVFETGIVQVRYTPDTATPAARSVTVPLPALTLQVGGRLISDALVPGSLRWQWAGQEYRDYGDGTVYRHAVPWTTQAGTLAGSVDYGTRTVTLTDYVSGAGALTVTSCLTRYGDWSATALQARTPGSPLRPASLYVRATAVDGTLLEGQADQSGTLTGTDVSGTIDQEMGVLSVAWAKPILPDTVRINCVVLSYLPLDADLLGLDPVRLPLDGRVPIIRQGDRLVVHHTASLALAAPAVAGSTHSLGRSRVARVRLLDATGARVPDDRIATSGTDLDTGAVRLASPLDLSGYVQPLSIEHTIEDAVMATSVDISGYVALNRALTHAYPEGSYCSSQLPWGDVWARYSHLFSQATWTGVWSDSAIGSATTGQYNDALYPIEVTNRGAITERWRVTMLTTTTYTVTGERAGQVAVGSTLEDCAPINPATGAPWFRIDYRGWGSGWAAGNVVRFNTVGGPALWAARTIQPGPATGTADSVRLAIRGDSAP